MAVPEYVIEQIRNSNDIVSVISEHIILKKTGANHKAVCPFHKEKTPSFVVSPDKQIFHCFGCGEGGNVFSFIMKYENTSFFDALKKLASRAGITLPEDAFSKQHDKSREERQLLYDINQEISDFYCDYLRNSSGAGEAREYLKKRGITGEIIDRFNVGYAPAAYGEVLRIGKEKEYSRDLLQKAGLISFSERSNKWIDKFFDRIIFPISDQEGRIIAFGGRTLKDRIPKYLNSPETPLFNKSRVLYGLDLAKRPVRENGMMIIVEGYMDVIACHQFGFNNTVATLGTALTEDHARIIPRYTEKVSIVYDSDIAGVNATLRGIEVLLDTNLNVVVAVFPDGTDPDSYLHSKGKEEFLKRIESGTDPVEYKISQAVAGMDVRKTGEKVSVASQVMPFLGRLKNKIQQEEGVRKLSEAINVPAYILKDELGKASNVKTALTSRVEKSDRQALAGLRLEKNLVMVLLKYPETMHVVFDERKLTAAEFNDRTLSEIVSVISELYKQGEKPEAKAVMSQVQKKHEKDEAILQEVDKMISSLSMAEIEYRNPEKTLRKLIADYDLKVRKKKYDESIKTVAESLQKGDGKDSRRFVEQYKNLKGTKN